MGNIRLRFVTDNDDFVSWAIRGAELGYWASHVEAALPDGSGYLGAHADGGVAIRPVGYDRAFKPLELFVDLPCADAQQDTFYGFLHTQVGKPYDMAIIRGFAVGALIGQRDWGSPDAWICSELEASGLLHAGIIKSIPSKNGYVTPRDVLMQCGVLVDVGEPVPAFPEASLPRTAPMMIGDPIAMPG